MTLKEKFEIATDGWIVADKCEEIADDFAIGFANWMSENSYKYSMQTTTKGLLEIYKKEKENKTEWYDEEKVDERIKIVGQNGNNGEHYTL